MRIRKYLTENKKREILEFQKNKCVYCDVQFDVLIQPEFDHFTPLAYLQKNPIDNFLASCRPCNRKKGSKIFDSIEQFRKIVIPRKIACKECGSQIITSRESKKFCRSRCRERFKARQFYQRKKSLEHKRLQAKNLSKVNCERLRLCLGMD